MVVRDRFSVLEDFHPGTTSVGESMTHQEFKDECDINRIMSRALRTGVLPVGVSVGRYGDFADVGDFHAAQQVIIESQRQFEAMPSKLRSRFENDAGKFLAWIQTASVDEASEFGLLSEEAIARRAASAVKDVAKPPA